MGSRALSRGSDNGLLPQVLAAMANHLRYWWTFAIVYDQLILPIYPRHIKNRWKPVVAFAPPHGRSNGMVAERARRLGYSHLVRGGRFTANRKGTSPYDLQRITIARGDSLREFAKKVSGAYQWLTFRDR